MNDQPNSRWPSLQLAEWRATYATLHMWTQIVGKTRLALAPMENHWWQVALYVTARGLTTSPMPAGERSVEVQFDFASHQLFIRLSDGSERVLPLTSMSVADFFERYMAAMHGLGIDPGIYAAPVEVETAIPFALDREHAVYRPDAARQCWQILLGAQRVMRRFRGRFLGKQSPVHFFWGSFDLACTRFSGRRAPRHPGGAPNCPDRVMVEAYSHECSSCGFWPGDENSAAFFYAYSYPQPPGFAAGRVASPARYDAKLREFVLPYDAVLTAPEPDRMLLHFFQQTYEAAADCGGWDRGALERESQFNPLD
ncbi:MAG TPA: DUF5996 family protein [Steroidobacteraceae bacterium]|jgi:hypothetical protein|nr:DUF5996 family protein [Steroidobacteraceae bacterium]